MGKSIWDWLETEPTTDIEAIKAAYAQGAKKYHPTEHPEEFKQLRDAYKMAIKIAKSHASHQGLAIYEVYGESSHMTDGDDVEADKKNDFDSANDSADAEKENTHNSGYDFSGAKYDVTLSDRQRRMISLFGRMLSFVHTDQKRFGHERVIETIMFNWDKSPYKEEITPAFIESALDIISECGGLSNGAANVVEKIFFADKTDSQKELLHSRFRSICPVVNSSSDSTPEFSTDDVQKCFCRLLDYPTPVICGWIRFGKDTPFNRRTKILPIKDILLFYDKKSVSYYFCEELLYSVDSKTENLTIYDLDNNVVLKMKPGNKSYAYLIDHIAENGSTNVGEEPVEKASFGEYSYIKKLYSLSGLWARVRVSFLVSGVVCLISFGVLSGCFAFGNWFSGLAKENIIMRVINWLFIILELVGISASGFVFIVCACYVLCHFIFMCELILKTELKKDIKSGHAVSVMNDEVWIFRRCLICVQDNIFNIVPFKNIASIEYATESENTAPKLKVTYNNGANQFIGIYSVDALMEVMTLINSWKKQIMCEDNRKTDANSGGKSEHFKSSFLVAEDFKKNYWGAVVYIICMLAIDIMMAYGIADGQSFFTQWRDLLWISVFGVMNLYAAGEIKLLYNLRKIPVDKLMDAQKQMLDVDAYRSEKYKIYVLNDYLVSMEHFEPIVIGYDEFSYIGKKFSNNEPVLLIQLKDSKRYEFCHGNEEAIDAILGKFAEKHKVSTAF